MKPIKTILLCIVGLTLFCFIIWNRLFRVRLPKELPIQLNEVNFIIFASIILILGLTIFNIIKRIYSKDLVEQTNIVIFDPILNTFSLSLKTLDSYIKDLHYIKKPIIYYSYQLLSIFVRNRTNKLYITFTMIPRLIPVLIFILELVIYHKLHIFYTSLMFLIIPLIARYLIYTFERLYENQCMILNERLTIFCIEPLNNTIDVDSYVKYTVDANLTNPRKKFSCNITIAESYIKTVCKKDNFDSIFFDKKKALDMFIPSLYSLCEHYLFIYNYQKEVNSYKDLFTLLTSSIYLCGWSFLLSYSFHTLPLDSFNSSDIWIMFIDNIEPFSQTHLDSYLLVITFSFLDFFDLSDILETFQDNIEPFSDTTIRYK